MSESEPSRPRTPADVAAFFQAATERLMAGWTSPAGGAGAVTGKPPGPWPAGTPALPATMSAKQLQALLDDLAARRAQVQALRTQLATFEEQLGSLEASLRPVLDWLRAWSDLEGSVTDFWRLQGGPPPGPEAS